MALTIKQRVTLVDKLSKLDDIPCVNLGGCAIVAIHLQSYIKQVFNKDSTIVYLLKKSDIDGISNLKNNKPDSCHHAMLKVGRYYYDTGGRYYKKTVVKALGSPVFVEVPTDLAVQSINQRDSWNPAFDRRSTRSIKAVLSK